MLRLAVAAMYALMRSNIDSCSVLMYYLNMYSVVEELIPCRE